MVEGKDDESRLKSLFDVDIIRTEGTHLSQDCLKRIEQAQKTKGVIVFTDPDHPGEEIRRRINDRIPGCKNAFLTSKSRKNNQVGVEHASEEELRDALHKLMTLSEEKQSISPEEFRELGLSGREDSRRRRELVEDAFSLGHGSAKTCLKRLNHRGLNKEEVRKVLEHE